MKTRQELVLDFMIALAGNSEVTGRYRKDEECARGIFLLSAELADKYISIVGG